MIKPGEYDLCVITGDFRARTYGEIEPVVSAMAGLRMHIDRPVYGILGNHDFLEFVPPVEQMGLPFLLNETVVMERNGQRIYLSGVDDPHFYETHNLQKAGDSIPPGAVSILLAHSPEIYRQAAAAGIEPAEAGRLLEAFAGGDGYKTIAGVDVTANFKGWTLDGAEFVDNMDENPIEICFDGILFCTSLAFEF